MSDTVPKMSKLDTDRLLPVLGHEQYLISENGRIYNAKTGRELAQTLNQGYPSVKLYKIGTKTKRHKIHRLVLSTFTEKLNNNMHINHIDGVRTNNKLENLEWCTHAYNMWHKKNVLHRKYNQKEVHPLFKITKEIAQGIIDKRRAGVPRKEVASFYGVSITYVSRILNHGHFTLESANG